MCWVSRISAAMGVEVSGIEKALVRLAFVDYRKTRFVRVVATVISCAVKGRRMLETTNNLIAVR